MCRPRILSVHSIYRWRPFSRSRKSELDILFTNQGAHYLSNGLLTNPLKDKWEIVSTSRQVIDRLRREEHEDLNQNQKFLSPPPPYPKYRLSSLVCCPFGTNIFPNFNQHWAHVFQFPKILMSISLILQYHKRELSQRGPLFLLGSIFLFLA